MIQTVAKPISDLNLTRQRLVQFLQRNESDHLQALEFFTSYYRSLTGTLKAHTKHTLSTKHTPSTHEAHTLNTH